MPISVDINHGASFVRVRGFGRVVLTDVLEYFRQLEQGAMRYPKLVDFSEAEPNLSERDIRVIAAEIQRLAAYEPRGPLAVVVRQTNEEVIRRVLHLAQGARPAVVCYDIAAAQHWLTEESADRLDDRL